VNRFHVQVEQELGKWKELIRIAEERHPLAVEILFHIGHHINQTSPLSRNLIGHRYTGNLAERHNEAVSCGEADRDVERFKGHLAALFESDCRRFGTD